MVMFMFTHSNYYDYVRSCYAEDFIAPPNPGASKHLSVSELMVQIEKWVYVWSLLLSDAAYVYIYIYIYMYMNTFRIRIFPRQLMEQRVFECTTMRTFLHCLSICYAFIKINFDGVLMHFYFFLVCERFLL